ncbi:hypothetical protein ILUMI_00587 [Ignelater luminosus]|uniref:Inositol 2-dehydrogenase n=1 Tax=Ignelater luminosus TaxID=2038154 RepID=A0A8K0DG58_IGNLU|nr:hypothetical protein ILUMI_00587 [Ignelater luminosus]
MATLKFKDSSLYKQENTAAPIEDYVYSRHVEDFEMQLKGNNNLIGIAVFGIGRAGTIHLTYLLRNPRVKVLYIVEQDKNKWNSIKSYWNVNDEVKFLDFDHADEVYKDKNVRAVIVTSPTKTHEDIVTKALDHDKAVFCEKPIAENIEKTRKCFEKAKQIGQPLLTAFNRRFDAAFSSVKERVGKGDVGHVNVIKTTSRDSPLPGIEYLKVSGGIFHDSAVHNIDTLIWILREYPIKVSVAASANIPEIAEIGDFDTIVILFTFPSGTLGIIDMCRYSNYGYDQRLEVFGFKGMLKVENQQPLQGVESRSENNRVCPIYYSFASRFQNSYVNEMDHFLNVVDGQEKLKVDYQDVLAVSKIASACEEAAKTGKIVEIHWDSKDLPF